MSIAPASASEPSSPATLDLAAKLARMKEAQRKGPPPGYDERLAALARLEKAVLAKRPAIVSAIARDFGHRSSHESLQAELLVILGAIRHARANLRDWMEPEERTVNWQFLPSTARVLPQPVGVVGIISPWNYPIQLALSPLVGALAAGNRALVKPSELVPESGAVLRDLLAEAFREDEVSVVLGGPEVAAAFSRLPFDHLLFTGSTRVGKLVMRAASENLVPVTLELGGKSPVIVGPDASPRTAAERVMTGKLFNAGQTCIAPDYVLLPAAARDAFVDACRATVAKLYPTLAANPDYTSIINDANLARLRGYLEDATAHGAQVIELNPKNEGFDGTRKMPPALVLDPATPMRVVEEEIFGPILPVMTYDGLDRAIAYVNDRPRPLSLYYFGHDRDAIDRVLAETVAGGVTVNETLLHFMQEDLPFGGVGASGMGQYRGKAGFDTFTKRKAVLEQSRLSARGLLRPPYGKTADRLLRALVR